LLIGLAALALIGLPRVTWRDDIRELEVPAAGLQREDAAIRAAFGQRGDRTVWLTQGRTLDEARTALRTLESHPAMARTTLANLGSIVPTAADHEQALRYVREHGAFPGLLRTALEARGFEPAEFDEFFAAWDGFARRGAAADLSTAIARVQRALAGPMGLLLHAGPQVNWFVTIVDGRTSAVPPPGTNTIALSQLQSLNDLFTRYRESALRLSLAGLAVVGLGIMVAYGVRDGLRIFAIPCGACVGIFGLFGWVGQPLNMFHLLGAFLGVCLTHDYAIFSAALAGRDDPPPRSVRLSALTTAASFGVLAMSAIPAVRALGATVALMVIAALAMIEIQPVRVLRGNRER
jgi:predicted exporter